MSFIDSALDFIGSAGKSLFGGLIGSATGIPLLGAAVSGLIGSGGDDDFSNVQGGWSTTSSAGPDTGDFYRGPDLDGELVRNGDFDEYGNLLPGSQGNSDLGGNDALQFGQSVNPSSSFTTSLEKLVSGLPAAVGGVLKDALGPSGLLNAGVTAFGGQQALEAQRETNALNRDLFGQAMGFNERMANQAQGFSAQQAQNQMDFQERMSNTSWQRSTADMMAAGINPMLAVTKGGASTPAGAMSSGVSANAPAAPTQISPRMAAIGTASQLATQSLTLQNLAAQNEEIRSRVAMNTMMLPKIEAETRSHVASASQLEALFPDITREQAARITKILREGDLVQAQTNRERALAVSAGAQARKDEFTDRKMSDLGPTERLFMEQIAPFWPYIKEGVGTAADVARSLLPRWRFR